MCASRDVYVLNVALLLPAGKIGAISTVDSCLVPSSLEGSSHGLREANARQYRAVSDLGPETTTAMQGLRLGPELEAGQVSGCRCRCRCRCSPVVPCRAASKHQKGQSVENPDPPTEWDVRVAGISSWELLCSNLGAAYDFLVEHLLCWRHSHILFMLECCPKHSGTGNGNDSRNGRTLKNWPWQY